MYPETLIDPDPTSSEALAEMFNRAYLMLNNKEYEQSKHILEKLRLFSLKENADTQTNDLYQHVVRQLGYVDFELGNTASAAKYLLEAQVFFPNDINIYESLTCIYRRQKKWKMYFQTLSLYKQNLKGVLRERYKFHLKRLNSEM